MKVSYRQTARDDLIRQFRYYLVESDVPGVAARFREAVKRTVESLRQHPLVGPRYFSDDPQLQNLRSWPVTGFEAIRIYYLFAADAIYIIRILHGKRDVRGILESE